MTLLGGGQYSSFFYYVLLSKDHTNAIKWSQGGHERHNNVSQTIKLDGENYQVCVNVRKWFPSTDNSNSYVVSSKPGPNILRYNLLGLTVGGTPPEYPTFDWSNKWNSPTRLANRILLEYAKDLDGETI